MIILHIAYVVNNKGSGVSSIVPKYIANQSKTETVGLLNLSDNELEEDIGNAKVIKYKNNSIAELEEPFNKPDLVVFHEVYRYPFIKLYKQLINNNIPYIIISHGSLNKKAQSKKKIKKLIANILFFKKFVKNSNKVQFLSDNERAMSLKFYKESYVLGNGIDIDKSIKVEKKSDNSFKYIYIGRFDIKVKGIDILLKACKYNQIYMRENNIKLMIYGRDSGKQKGSKYIKRYIKKNKLYDIIKLNPAVYDREKIEKILDADIFIQTSRNEGQPLSVLEALGYGKPVIVTPGTNFADIVEEKEMGWKAKFDSQDVALKMQQAYQFSKKNGLDTYSNNAKTYVENNFMWEDITQRALSMYQKTISKESDLD